VLLAYRVPVTADVVVARLAPGGGRPRWTRDATTPGRGFGPLSLLPGGHARARPLLGLRDDLGGAEVDEAGPTVTNAAKPAAGTGGTATAAPGAAPYAVGRPALLDGSSAASPNLVYFGIDAVPRLAAAHDPSAPPGGGTRTAARTASAQ
jgi:hypothetical protein